MLSSTSVSFGLFAWLRLRVKKFAKSIYISIGIIQLIFVYNYTLTCKEMEINATDQKNQKNNPTRSDFPF